MMASFEWKVQPAFVKIFHEKTFGLYFHRSRLGISAESHNIYLVILDLNIPAPGGAQVMGLSALPVVGPYTGPWRSEFLLARKQSNNQAQVYFNPGMVGVVGCSPRIITITTPGIQDEVILE